MRISVLSGTFSGIGSKSLRIEPFRSAIWKTVHRSLVRCAQGCGRCRVEPGGSNPRRGGFTLRLWNPVGSLDDELHTRLPWMLSGSRPESVCVAARLARPALLGGEPEASARTHHAPGDRGHEPALRIASAGCVEALRTADLEGRARLPCSLRARQPLDGRGVVPGRGPPSDGRSDRVRDNRRTSTDGSAPTPSDRGLRARAQSRPFPQDRRLSRDIGG
jgi:hypothetical protein